MQETDAVLSAEELGRRLNRLQLQLDQQAHELNALRHQLDNMRPATTSPTTVPATAPPVASQGLTQLAQARVESPARPASQAAPAAVRVQQPPVAATPSRPAPAAVPAFGTTAPVEKAAPPQRSVENRIGAQLFNRIAIIALLIGVALALKFAYDKGWLHVSPIGRIASGLVLGAGVILWSERFRSKGYSAFSYSMKAVGTGTLYLTLWASFQMYHLLPAPVALAMMIGVTAWNAAMAWLQDSELLAAYALIGGFASPALLRSGGNHETFLFTYILALDAAVLFLVIRKPWQRLLLGSFTGTVVYFIGWYVEFWSPAQALATGLFGVLLAVPFIAVALVGKQRDDVYEGVLAPLAGAAFLVCTMYSVLEDSGRHAWLAWAAVLIAAIYLLLMRLRRNGLAEAVHLVIAIVLLTIAIPLKASGRWVTIGWLAEGVALLWASAKLLGPTVQVRVRHCMRVLATCALALGVAESLIFWSQENALHAFWNARFATELFAVAALALAARIAVRNPGADDHDLPAWPVIRLGATLAAHLLAPLVLCRELAAYWTISAPGQESYQLQLCSLSIASLLGVYAACLLAWLAFRKAAIDGALRTTLFAIAICYLLLSGFATVTAPSVTSADNLRPFLNGRLVFECITLAALALSAWFGRMALAARSNAATGERSWSALNLGATLVGHILAAVVTSREIATAWAVPADSMLKAYHDQLRVLSLGTFLLCYGAALFSWTALRPGERSLPRQRTNLRALSFVYLALGYLPVLIAPVFSGQPSHVLFNTRLALELLSSAALGFTAWIAWHKRREPNPVWVPTAAVTCIAFNLLILFTGIHEIFTYFGNTSSDATLAEAFSISAWLMLYAAGLLAAGFWKRMSFIRWQGLVLLVFTILKVFLYDTHSLSSGYRILSFFGLGIVLMIVSFAYQKDWLHLREADTVAQPVEATE